MEGLKLCGFPRGQGSPSPLPTAAWATRGVRRHLQRRALITAWSPPNTSQAGIVGGIDCCSNTTTEASRSYMLCLLFHPPSEYLIFDCSPVRFCRRERQNR